MYYRLDWRVVPSDPSLANTGRCPDLGIPWTMGVRVAKPVREPIACELNPARGRTLRDAFLTDIPLFSTRLLEALGAAGVDNLQSYAATVRTPEGQVHSNYRAVNIVGAIACASLEKSEVLPGTEAPMMEFARLVLDEKRALGAKFFRLAENTLCILVSHEVKLALDPLRLVGVSLEAVESVA